MCWLRRALYLSVFFLCACAAEGEGARELWQRGAALAVKGPWQIPASTLEAGDMQYVAYEGAGPWRGETGCAGGLLSGTRLVGDFLAEHYPQISLVGGYSCRAIRGATQTMSVHGVGRALDLHIPTLGNPAQADNDLGDEVGELLIAHAELLGIQLIIWDEWSWGASRAMGNKGRMYTGVNPHHDHLHVELSAEAASRQEDWFSAVLAPVSMDAGSDAGLDTSWDGGGSGLDPELDASLPGPAAPEQEVPGPFVPKPVIEPILDDDPMLAPPLGAQPPNNDNTIYGSSCSVQGPGRRAAYWPFGWLTAALFAHAVRVARRAAARRS